MMMVQTRIITVALLSLAGCGTKYTAAIELKIIGASPTLLGNGGGYYVDLTRADGERMRGVERAFVEFHPGDQEVTVVLQDDGYFGSSDKLRVRVRVEAVASKSALPEAVGVEFVALERGGAVGATVTLHADPRPLDGVLFATYGSAEADLDGRRVVLTWDDLVRPDGYSLHAGLRWTNGAYHWLGQLEQFPTGSGTFTVDQGPLYLDADIEVVVTAEAEDADGPLTGPGEWFVFRGALHAQVREKLSTLLGPSGELADVIAIHEPALLHAGFARDTIPSAADTLIHCEHVFVAINGKTLSKEGDLNASGEEDTIVVDDAGVVSHLQAVRQVLTDLSESSPDGILRGPDGVAARACSDAAIGQVTVIKGAATALAADLASTAKAGALVEAVADFRGEPFSQGDPQTFACLLDRVEAHSIFTLLALAKGAL